MITVALSVAIAPFLVVLSPVSSKALPCPTTVEVGDTDFLSSCSVQPTLQTSVPDLIYIPTRPPQGFIVERLDPEATLGTRPGPELVNITKRFFFGYPPLRYNFADPPILRLDWCSVGQPRADGLEGCEVPPGIYRLSILYSVVDPRKGPGRERQLCRAYSPAFKLRKSCGYVTYHSTISPAKPNHRMNPSAGGGLAADRRPRSPAAGYAER